MDIDYVFNRKRGHFNIGTITGTGHSLGGALAMLAAYHLAQEPLIPSGVQIRACTFEAPKVGTLLVFQYICKAVNT